MLTSGVAIDANSPPPADYQDVDGETAVDVTPETRKTLSAGSWDAKTALRVVIQDFNRAAAWRSSNVESLWQESNATYVAAKRGDVFWEGTRTPRANLDVHQAFQQVNALRPQVIDAICGADLDFDVEASKSGTTVGQLHLVRSVMQYFLRSLGGEVKFQTFRSCVDRMVEDGLVLGNGIWEWGWDGPRTVEVPKWVREDQPEIAYMSHPMLSGKIPYLTGGTVSVTKPKMVEERVSKFFLDPVDLQDFYIDPDTRSPNVQSAGFVIRRKLMTIAELGEYRGKEGWSIPPDVLLYAYSRTRTSTQGDSTRDGMASDIGVNRNSSGTDESVDPRLARVEVLRYWQRGRHVWVIGRKHVAWNYFNQYQALPFFSWCYVNKPGQFYGFSIPELLRTDQKLIKTLLDGRMDELNLILHPPFISKPGTFRTQSQSKLRPGANWEAMNPKEDVVRVEMGDVTRSAYVEVDAAENRGQKKTGVTDLAVLGTPTSGGNSANRTATGVQAQTNASNSRVHGLVAQIEDTCLGPMLSTEWELIQRFCDPDDLTRVVGSDAKTLEVDVVDLLNSDARFVMKTANNMKMRAAMQNGGLNQLNTFLLNPEIQTLLAEQQGKVVDIEQMVEFTLDVYGVKSFTLVRPMTPQEQQAKQARQQQAGQEKMGLQTARLAAMSQDAQERDETKVMVALIQGLAQAGLLHLASGIEAPVQLEARRLEAEISGGQTGPNALQLAQQSQQPSEGQ